MLEKFKSRKFLMALLSTVLGVLTMFGVANNTVETVSAIGMILIPAIIYIAVEGVIDVKTIKKIVDTAEEVIDLVDGEEESK